MKASREFLAEPGNDWCRWCGGPNPDMVDHIQPHKGDMNLFWSRANWQAMHQPCNSKKARGERR